MMAAAMMPKATMVVAVTTLFVSCMEDCLRFVRKQDFWSWLILSAKSYLSLFNCLGGLFVFISQFYGC